MKGVQYLLHLLVNDRLPFLGFRDSIGTIQFYNAGITVVLTPLTLISGWTLSATNQMAFIYCSGCFESASRYSMLGHMYHSAPSY